MNFKSVLAVCTLALASVNAISMEEYYRNLGRFMCNDRQGLFLESNEANDKRFACLLPQTPSDNPREKYCEQFNGKDYCYAPEFSNVDVCNMKSKDFNSKGCFLGLGYLHNMRRSVSRSKCNERNGLFLEGDQDSDKRFACLLPKTEADNGKYCGGFDGKSYCYAREFGNLDYCDTKSNEYNSKGCFYSISYLYNNRK